MINIIKLKINILKIPHIFIHLDFSEMLTLGLLLRYVISSSEMIGFQYRCFTLRNGTYTCYNEDAERIKFSGQCHFIRDFSFACILPEDVFTEKYYFFVEHLREAQFNLSFTGNTPSAQFLFPKVTGQYKFDLASDLSVKSELSDDNLASGNCSELNNGSCLCKCSDEYFEFCVVLDTCEEKNHSVYFIDYEQVPLETYEKFKDHYFPENFMDSSGTVTDYQIQQSTMSIAFSPPIVFLAMVFLVGCVCTSALYFYTRYDGCDSIGEGSHHGGLYAV